jgi:hypothetical protein
MVRIGNYDYKKSTRPDKKLMVEVDGKTIHFGSRAMSHYKDKTEIWKSKDHGDIKRLKAFRKRMKGIKLKDGTKAVNNPKSPAYHSLRILW